ncbi:MAG: hypothetical protein H6730_01920 [Deltaproteobacteria bacterium]|nr:hypothetical protein [Deltaproteobacteria bacterium]
MSSPAARGHPEEAYEIVAAFGRRLLAPIFPTSVAIYTSRASADALELRQAWGRTPCRSACPDDAGPPAVPAPLAR